MVKTIGAYVNVALADYDESMKNHLIELLKESLREQSTEFILENTWEVVEKKRKLYKNKNGELQTINEEASDIKEILEVMTVELTVKVEGTVLE